MKLKRIMVAVLSIAMVAASSVMAFADNGISADEQKILDKLNAGVVVNGTTVKVPAEYMNQAEKYLASNDVKADEVATINSKIDDAFAVVKSEGVTDLKKLSKDAKDKVLADAKAAAVVVGVTLTVDTKTGVITGTKADGTVVFTAKSSALITSTESPSTSTGVIKATGFGVNATVAVAVALVVGLFVCSIVADKKKLFA